MGHSLQTLPPPTGVPPWPVHASAWRQARGPVALMQPVAGSQTMVASLLHTPAAVPSPGNASLQVPLVSYTQQRTAPSLPQVERAAQLWIVRLAAASRQPALRSAFRKCATQLTY